MAAWIHSRQLEVIDFLREENRLLTPLEHAVRPANNNASIERHERLGRLLNFYYRRVA